MTSEYGGVYLPTVDPNTFESTPLANAGWYEEGQHGGAIASLFAFHAERTPTLTDMRIARITVELFRAVPLVPLTISSEVVREGKKIQVIHSVIDDPAGTPMATATIHRLRLADVDLPAEAATPTTHLKGPLDCEPMDPGDWGHGEVGKTMFHRSAIEVREITGGFTERGPGAVWIRLTESIVADEENSHVLSAIAVGDFCNGVARSLDEDWVFMNSDLTVSIGRYPQTPWVALDAESRYSSEGRGLATGSLWDEKAWVGRSMQTLFIDRT